MQRQLWNTRAAGVAVLIAAALAWPTLLCALTDALASPYERALSAAWCGAGPQTAFEFLGHCPACWSGALALLLAATLVSLDRREQLASVRQ